MEPLVAVYDACVLYSSFLRDFLVWLAIHGRRQKKLRGKWTGRIHQEWIRAVLRNRRDLQRPALRRTARLLDEHVAGCRVYQYRRWIPRLQLPDLDDRHVLAAALACVADVIVTQNVADFPAAVLNPFGVTAEPPDIFIRRLLEIGVVVAAATEHRASMSRPAMSPGEYLDALRRNGLPDTADALVGKAI